MTGNEDRPGGNRGDQEAGRPDPRVTDTPDSPREAPWSEAIRAAANRLGGSVELDEDARPLPDGWDVAAQVVDLMESTGYTFRSSAGPWLADYLDDDGYEVLAMSDALDPDEVRRAATYAAAKIVRLLDEANRVAAELNALFALSGAHRQGGGRR